MKTELVMITVITTGRSNGKITPKNTRRGPQPSMIAASSSSRGIAAMKVRNRRITNGTWNATSTRMSPGIDLNKPSF
jgi:hypothetical protein